MRASSGRSREPPERPRVDRETDRRQLIYRTPTVGPPPDGKGPASHTFFTSSRTPETRTSRNAAAPHLLVNPLRTGREPTTVLAARNPNLTTPHVPSRRACHELRPLSGTEPQTGRRATTGNGASNPRPSGREPGSQRDIARTGCNSTDASAHAAPRQLPRAVSGSLFRLSRRRSRVRVPSLPLPRNPASAGLPSFAGVSGLVVGRQINARTSASRSATSGSPACSNIRRRTRASRSSSCCRCRPILSVNASAELCGASGSTPSGAVARSSAVRCVPPARPRA